MRFLVDAQLPVTLCTWLANRNHEAMHVSRSGSPSMADREISVWAARDRLVLITKDQDFLDLRQRYGFSLVWLRCGNANTPVLEAWLSERWPAVEGLLLEGSRFIELH